MIFRGLFASSSSSPSSARPRSPRRPKSSLLRPQPSLPSLFRSASPSSQDAPAPSASTRSAPIPAPTPTPDSAPCLPSTSDSHHAVTPPPPPPAADAPPDGPEPRHSYICDESQLRPVPEPAPDLRDLNGCLEALAEVFTDVQVEVFREMLSSFDGESRLAVVADALLKSRGRWVRGRVRVGRGGRGGNGGAGERGESGERGERGEGRAEDGGGGGGGGVPPRETFRSAEYQRAVRALAWSEFRGLSRSTINAVLAESNYSYLEARPTLVSISAKSWRFTISSIFLRRTTRPILGTSPAGAVSDLPGPAEAHRHPLVVWRPSPSCLSSPCSPALRPTGSSELDAELYRALVLPIKQRAAAARLAKDRALAHSLNQEQAEAENMMHECSVCFGDSPFEQVAACTAEGHLTCFGCVRRAVAEAVFGQGWRSSIRPRVGTLRCLSTEAGTGTAGDDGCPGHVPADLLRLAVVDDGGDGNGAEVMRRFDARLAEHSLLGSGLPLVRCPFCDYAEVDEVYHPAGAPRLRIRAATAAWYNLILGLFFASLLLPLSVLAPPLLVFGLVLVFLSFVVLLALAAGVAACVAERGTAALGAEWRLAVARRRRRDVGARFTCRSPRCGRASCLRCAKAWTDVHVCHESALVALRVQVEQAMSLAVKRVCPRCATSFVKNSGCNKLTCPCGYKMCYMCRADLTEEGYRHFCEHFRPEADAARPCDECDRCSLWETEDTERILREAREEAERRWREAESRRETPLTKAERSFIETGIACGGGGGEGNGTRVGRGGAGAGRGGGEPGGEYEDGPRGGGGPPLVLLMRVLMLWGKRSSSMAEVLDAVVECVFE